MTKAKYTPEMEREANNLDGIYAGLCKPEEYEPLIAAGLLKFDYEGAAGFMGLAKLRRT
jgi:hypothetical protein